MHWLLKVVITGFAISLSACTANETPKQKTILEQFDSINKTLIPAKDPATAKTDSLLKRLDSMANH